MKPYDGWNKVDHWADRQMSRVATMCGVLLVVGFYTVFCGACAVLAYAVWQALNQGHPL